MPNNPNLDGRNMPEPWLFELVLIGDTSERLCELAEAHPEIAVINTFGVRAKVRETGAIVELWVFAPRVSQANSIRRGIVGHDGIAVAWPQSHGFQFRSTKRRSACAGVDHFIISERIGQFCARRAVSRTPE